jgi:hypothetical protein
MIYAVIVSRRDGQSNLGLKLLHDANQTFWT